jgi:transposase
MGGDDHRCEWRDKAEALESRLAQVEATLAKLQRHHFGKRSEKMPPVDEALRRAGVPADPAAALEKRRENAEKKRALVTREIHHKVADEQKTCPKCGGRDFTPVGKGKITGSTSSSPRRSSGGSTSRRRSAVGAARRS